MEKYPRVVAYIAESRKENLDAAMEFYQKGVNQGIFRKDVNYAIVRVMVGEQMDIDSCIYAYAGHFYGKGIEDCR